MTNFPQFTTNVRKSQRQPQCTLQLKCEDRVCNSAHPHHVTRHNTPIHNILSTAPQFSISQKALETLPEDGNVMQKHAEATKHN
jgi:ApbE superfamily uncharacterized protein (UPF0280 family)